MKNIEKYTETEFKHLIADIRRQKPILPEAEALLAATIKQLPDRPSNKTKQYFEFYKIVLNTAAIFLIGLFIFQYIIEINAGNSINNDIKTDIAPIAHSNNNRCKKSESSNLFYYKELYACYLENNKRTPNPFRKYIK